MIRLKMKKNDRPFFIYFNVSFWKKYNTTNYQYMQGCNLFMTTGLENDRVLYKKTLQIGLAPVMTIGLT